MSIKILNSNVDKLGSYVLDYKLCIFCQRNKNEILQDPAKAKRISAENCYNSMGSVLKVFKQMSKLPQRLSSALASVTDISKHLKDISAKWHKSCKLQYSKTRADELSQQVTNINKETQNSNKEITIPHKVRSSLRSEQPPNCSLFKCFFCDNEDKESNLRLSSTYSIDANVRTAAQYLRDEKLISKLCAGDMIAIEARYHLACWSNYKRKFEMAKEIENKKTKSEDDASWFESVALAELFAYIELTMEENDKVVMPLTELHSLLETRISELSHIHQCVNRTRLKDKISAQFPQLAVSKSGRNVVFSKDAVAYHKVDDNLDDEAKALMKAAMIVRKKLFQKSQNDQGKQETSVHQTLLTLIGMILEGSNLQGDDNKVSQAVLTISQLIKFNSVRRSKEGVKNYHTVSQETPLVRFIGTRLHAIHAKDLIETLFKLGICISYKRVLEISAALGQAACETFREVGIVCPTNISKNEFITFAVDNIDHNMSSTTSTGSFHGTAISIRTHPDLEEATPTMQTNFMSIVLPKRNLKIPELPSEYTLVENIPEINRKFLKIPQRLTPLNTTSLYKDAMEIEQQWAHFVESHLQLDSITTEKVHWSSYHASRSNDKIIHKCTTALLPLFVEKASDPSMIYHALKIAMKTTNFLNPDQSTVVAGDEPLFAIIKELQWAYPDLFSNIVPMMGGLHHEMVLLRCLGQWLEGSEWETALCEANIANKGVAQSFLNGSHVTKCRYVHEVTAAVLHILKRRAFLKEGLPDTVEVFSKWNGEKAESHPTFHYWDQVLQLEQCLLIFVRSNRVGNFSLYKSTLEEAVPWYFALGHYKYAAWTCVHLNDMKTLNTEFPDVYSEFMKGKFVVAKTKRRFSAMPIDQSHEQENAMIKGVGGALNLLDNPSALRRWMVSGPEVARLINSFENEYLQKSDYDHEIHHHSETKSNQELFLKHTRDLLEKMEEYGNPFEDETSSLVTLITKFQFDENAVATVKHALEKGKTEYNDFVTARLDMQSSNFFDKVSLNNFRIFKEKPPAKVSKFAQKNKLLQNDVMLFSRLYIGARHRSADLDEFFSHENQPFPISISDNGHMRQGTKSDTVTLLEDLFSDIYVEEPKDITSFHIEGAIIPYFIAAVGAKTFDCYSKKCQSYIHSFTRKYKRVDIVWDTYRLDSLKNSTREKRGKGRIQSVKPSLCITKSWSNFLNVNENKDQLFRLLAQDIVKFSSSETFVVSTIGENVLCSQEYDTSKMSPCTHEESDTRIFIHVLDAVSEGHKKLAIRTVDSDVVVLAVAFVAKIKEIEELWILFGTKTKFRYIPIHLIVKLLGVKMSLALPFFHAITGCDTVSSFFGIGKQTAFNVWTELGDVLTDAFLNIQFENFNDPKSEYYKTIVRFITMCYGCNQGDEIGSSLDATRQFLFVIKDRKLQNIPPTSAAFIQHLKRAVLQGSFFWDSTTKAKMCTPDPALWGWQLSESGTYEPYWSSKAELSKTSKKIIRCTCKSSCSGRCSCKEANIPCAAFCACGGTCYK